MLNEKQINIVNWMYNYCRIEMIARNDEYTFTDIDKLTSYVIDRFPDQYNEILKLYEV